jgi:hypothetical protein
MFGFLNLYFQDVDRALSVANGYLADPDKYTRLHSVPLNGKRRQLRAYADSKEGRKLRELHEAVARFIWSNFQSSNQSFAYKKGRSIVDCVRSHMNGKVFLKSDIHAFFDSTTLENFLESFFKNPKFKADRVKLTTILSACFYGGTLPLGFACSPAISDFYLHELDRRMTTVPGVTYTRYADDFLVSTSSMNGEFMLEKAMKTLRDELTKLGLEINERKTFIRTLKQEGDSIRFLGLNIVRTGYPFNRITVGISFLKETSMDLGKAIKGSNQAAYEAARGKISFIRMCSEDSLEKFKGMVRAKLGVELDEILASPDVKQARYAMKINRL